MYSVHLRQCSCSCGISKINECKAVSITGDTDTGLRRESLEKFKDGEINVITNYGVLTTGFDAPNIGVVVIARPTLSVVLYSQMVGRGIRGPLFNGTDHCIVLNVEDNIRNLPNYDASVYFTSSMAQRRVNHQYKIANPAHDKYATRCRLQKTSEVIAEIVDNSIEANARNINITLFKDSNHYKNATFSAKLQY